MSQFKKKLTAFSAMLAFLSVSGAASFAYFPGEVQGQTGNVGFNQNGNRLDVNINSGVNGAVGQVDWKNFSVGAGQHVNFGFSGTSQTIINRVLGGEASTILGKLTNSCMNGSCDANPASSKVILINPAGVVFGAGSLVDLNSFTVSTFDFTGAKNLKGMSASQLSDYQRGVLNKLSPIAAVNGENRNTGTITFDSNYVDAFNKAGVKYDPGKTSITLDGTIFSALDENGNIQNYNENKSIALVSDNITYRDSILRTGSNLNYGDKISFGNVRLVTADGVSFTYSSSGYARSYEAKNDTKTDVVRKIDIDNSGLAAGTQAIRSGGVTIENKSNAAGSDIKIANTVVRATKLINNENGDIIIMGSKNVDITGSELVTANTQKTSVNKDTFNQHGGEIFISAGKNLNIKDTTLSSSGSKDTSAAASEDGAVSLYAYDGDVNVKNSKVFAGGKVGVISTKNTNIENSAIQANNKKDNPTSVHDVKIAGTNSVTIKNSAVDASGNVDIRSAYTDTKNLSGNINIITTKDAATHTLISAGDKISIQGKNTLIDNSAFKYDELHFYNDGTNGLNNVTLKGDTQFTQKLASGALSPDVILETNGNFTLDGATVSAGDSSLTFIKNNNNFDYNVSLSPQTADNIKITSTQGNVTATNKTNLNAKTDIDLISKTGDVTVGNNTLITAGRDANLTAQKNVTIKNSLDSNSSANPQTKIEAGRNANILAKTGDVTIKMDSQKTGNGGVIAKTDVNIEATQGALHIGDNANILADNDINIKSYETITFGPQGANNINIDNTTKIAAGKYVNITSTNGDINAEKTTMPTIEYGQRLTFNAKGSNNFTSEDSLKSVNVDYIAGTANNFTTKGDIQFVNSSLKSKNNNITTTQEGGDVILNDLRIVQATADAKDTITTINAKGNVTSNDVTGTAQSDVNQAVHKFPQSVNVKFNVDQAKAAGGNALDVNNTKLIVKTSVAKDPANPDNGSIILNVVNAANKDAGIELTAENSGGWDGISTEGEGPEIHINAKDDQLAVSRIVTDKLFTDANDKMYAADVSLTAEEKAGLPADTPSKGYIEVRDYMGFNQDVDFTQENPDDFTYTGHYVPGIKHNDDGDLDINKKHTINFGDTNEDFILVYDRPLNDCELPPDEPVIKEVVKDEPISADSYINVVRLPREQVEISKTSKVSDNTVDQTSSIMSAAAKVDLGQDSANSDDEDESDD